MIPDTLPRWRTRLAIVAPDEVLVNMMVRLSVS